MSSSKTKTLLGKPLDRYAERMNFRDYIFLDQDFKAYTDEHGISLQEPQFLLQLAKTLLKMDFGLKLEMPVDHLIPMVANRYIYVHWVRELMRTTNPTYAEEPEEGRKICGLDIGVGAACIYALLALATEPDWFMLGTDIDTENIEFARKNVALNELDDRCKIFKSDAEAPLMPFDLLKNHAGIDHLDFVMCNPPFFATVEEWRDSLNGVGKMLGPKANCTGNENEMVTEGGDAMFILRMIEESTTLKQETTTTLRKTWFTCLVGRKKSLDTVVLKLRELGCLNYAIKTLVIPTSTTRRWLVGWSWGDLRPAEYIARAAPGVDPTLLPPCLLFTIQYKAQASSDMLSHLLAWLNSLDLQWDWNEAENNGIGKAKEDVWCRRYRRSHNRDQSNKQTKGAVRFDDNDNDVAFGFKIEARPRVGRLTVRWMQGLEHQLFISFCSSLQSHLRGHEKIESWSGIRVVGKAPPTEAETNADGDDDVPPAEDGDRAQLVEKQLLELGGDEQMDEVPE